MRHPNKALKAIEILVGGDFGMDMECWLSGMTKWNDKQIKSNLKEAAEIMGKIYMIAHADTCHGCSHPDWEKIKYEIIKESN